MNFKEIQQLVYEEYVKNKFQENWEKQGSFGDFKEFAKVAEEVFEGLDEISKNDLPKLRFECADIVIRIMNFCTRKGIDLEHIIKEKNRINLNREELHGEKVI